MLHYNSQSISTSQFFVILCSHICFAHISLVLLTLSVEMSDVLQRKTRGGVRCQSDLHLLQDGLTAFDPVCLPSTLPVYTDPARIIRGDKCCNGPILAGQLKQGFRLTSMTYLYYSLPTFQTLVYL